jgi:hypothetical protein
LFLRNDAQMNKIRDEHIMTSNPELWEKLETVITAESYA